LANSSTIETAEAMAAQMLIVSGNLPDLPVIQQACHRYALKLEACAEPANAAQLLERQKFEAIMVDLSLGDSGKDFLEAVRQSRTNRTAITFALVNGREQSASASSLGSAFILQRPVTADAMSGTMKVAFGLIMRERRRYFRCETSVPVTLNMDDGMHFSCRTVNLSEGGLAVATEVDLPAGEGGTIRLQLEEPNFDFASQVRVCWATENGHAGLNFVSLAPAVASQLQGWLWLRLEKTLPPFVLAKFREQRG
jgi:hypothetical protein